MELINQVRRQEQRYTENIKQEAFSRFTRVMDYIGSRFGDETARQVWNVFVTGDELKEEDSFG